MVDKQQLIDELGLTDVPAEEQDAVYDDFILELGAAINDGLTDEQVAEFGSIIDGDQGVIDAWLAANEPGYRDDPSYQQLEAGYREDPEKVPADKVYASLGWIRVNRPDFANVVERTKREFRVRLEAERG